MIHFGPPSPVKNRPTNAIGKLLKLNAELYTIFPTSINVQLAMNGVLNAVFVQILYTMALPNDAIGIIPISNADTASSAPKALTYMVLDGSTM
jgi:hypothetical protein